MAAGVINTGSYPKLLWPGIYHCFGMGYNEPKQEWKSLLDTFVSKQKYEEIVQTVGFGPAPEKPESTPVIYDSSWQGFVTRFNNVSYGLAYAVTREERDDNLYKDVAEKLARSLGNSFRQTKETVAANLYNQAFTNTNMSDGTTLINNAHPLQGGGTNSNTLSVAADLSEASLEDLWIQMALCVDDRGMRISIMPRSLIVHPDNMFTAQRILKSTFQSGTANNDIGVLNYMNIFPEGMKVNRFLTSPGAYFIRTDIDPKSGPILLQRTQIEFSDDNDFNTMNTLYKGFERYSVGCADHRGLYGVNGP